MDEIVYGEDSLSWRETEDMRVFFKAQLYSITMRCLRQRRHGPVVVYLDWIDG